MYDIIILFQNIALFGAFSNFKACTLFINANFKNDVNSCHVYICHYMYLIKHQYLVRPSTEFYQNFISS